MVDLTCGKMAGGGHGKRPPFDRKANALEWRVREPIRARQVCRKIRRRAEAESAQRPLVARAFLRRLVRGGA